MNDWALLLVNIGIGSVIGGVTNELAIRMLFRPYKPWMIGSFRVPFTPGLIPRRRDEIGVQMGRLVEHHLLTVEGVKRAIAQSGAEAMLRAWLTGLFEKWLASDRSLKEQIQGWVPGLFTAEGGWSEHIRQPIQHKWKDGIRMLLHRHGERTIASLVSESARDRLKASVDSLGRMILERFADYLRSSEGQRDVQQMIRGLLGGGGGMFGGLMGMFLGDDKMVAKILPYLEDILQSPELAQRLSDFLHQEVDKLLQKPLHEVVSMIGEAQIDEWSEALFQRLEEQSLEWLDQPPAHWFSNWRESVVQELIPRVTKWAVTLMEQNVETLFTKLSITEIVTRQVESFPLERVEEMIVGISGKEFRMITVLGFILGGIIGAVQGVIGLMW